MTFTVPDGYLDGPRAAAAAHRFCTTAGERCPEALRPGLGQHLQAWIIKVFPPWIVAEFANERIPTYGIRATDGKLTTLDAGLWRSPLFIAAEVGYGGSTGRTKEPGLAFVLGNTFDLRRSRISVLPIVAACDLLEALGSKDLPSRPAIRPEGEDDAQPPPNARVEAARWWMLGYATGLGRPAKRDDAIAECTKAVSCTVREAGEAYKALPNDRRNPSPEQRSTARAARGGK